MPDTSLDSLRARVAPHLLQDFDAVREEWTEETGSTDADRFLAHLVAWGLVPRELQSTDRSASPEGARRRFRKVGDALRETGGIPGLESAQTPVVLAAPSDRYEVIGVIGEGAMGRIELVRDRELARRVAYKRMAAGLESQPVLARRFADEARITAQLDHPGIVPVYTVEGRDAYTMKWVEGRTLRGLVEEARAARGDGPDLLDVFVRVGETIAYAHARGVLHRDLKPENVMVGRFGETWVMDWGIARVFRTDVESPISVQQDDEGDLVIGTPGYMSPEQAAGRNAALGPASDQYSLGLVLFEIVAHKPALTGRNAMALVTRNQEGEHDPLPASVPPDLAAIVAKALQLDPARRYPSVQALVDDVRRHQRGLPVSARPEGLVRRVLRIAGRRADVLVVSMVVLLALAFTGALGTVSVVTWRAQRADAEAQAARAVLVEASSHARRIEGQMLKFEGLVNVVAAIATDGGSSAGVAPAWSAAFAARETAPPDAIHHAPSDKYGPGLVSSHTPVFVAAAGVDPGARAEIAAGLLAPARRHLARVLLRSHDERRATVSEAIGRRTILEVEIPARRAWLWHPDGVLVALPGQEWPADPSSTPAVAAGRSSEAPSWLAPQPDVTGRPVISVTVAVPRDEGTPGVAGVDLSAAWFEANLLPEVWKGRGARGFLLDAKGAVVAATDGTAVGAVPFPDLAAAFAERRTGDLGEGSEAVLVHPLATSGWWSVIVGDRAALAP